jgi:dGTP triphosphohydrolase
MQLREVPTQHTTRTMSTTPETPESNALAAKCNAALTEAALKRCEHLETRLREATAALEACAKKLTEVHEIAGQYADVDDGQPNDMMKIIAIMGGQL